MNSIKDQKFERKICFEAGDGDLVCNYVVVRGRIIRSKKGWIKFTPKKGKKLPKEPTA